MPAKASKFLRTQKFQHNRAPFFGALFVFLSVYCSNITANECAADRSDETVAVQAVVDGDTVRLRDGRKLRVIGINTPELGKDGRPAEPFAVEAKARLEAWIPAGSQVKLRYDVERSDRHDRVLAHVFSQNGENLAARLLQDGLAMAITVPPNLWQYECYFALDAKAQQARRGLWSSPAFAPHDLTLSRLQPGFQRLRGKLTRVDWNHKGAWLELDGQLQLRITRGDKRYFSREELPHWIGKTVIVRGWLRRERDEWRMHLRHPSMLQH